MQNTENTVVITEEKYKTLLADKRFLVCLKVYGVDNWEGYELAQEMFNKPTRRKQY